MQGNFAPRLIMLLLLVGGAVASSCISSRTEPEPDSPSDPNAVEIRLTANLRFEPPDVTVDPGTTVRWVNAANVFHTVTPDNSSQLGVWARATTSTVGPVLTHTFNQSSQTYTYHCEPHRSAGMTGVIRVR